MHYTYTKQSTAVLFMHMHALSVQLYSNSVVGCGKAQLALTPSWLLESLVALLRQTRQQYAAHLKVLIAD
jgi:hypothetical protein